MINENAGYEICDVCGCHVLVPWSNDSMKAKFNLHHWTVICTEECYWNMIYDPPDQDR